MYNASVEPKHLNDVALVKLSTEVEFKKELLPVCLWNETDMNKETYEGLFNKQFGVVTGWGKSDEDKNSDYSNNLKQMQMEIKTDSDCTKNLDRTQTKGVNMTAMFCAGGTDNIDGVTKIIDACRGDSGGPFVVQSPVKENHFIQIGVVSFGFGCKKNGTYGFYTKLTPDIVRWIHATIKKNAA